MTPRCLGRGGMMLVPSSMQALYSRDQNLLETEFEYLEKVLPEDIRQALWRHVGASRPRSPKRRTEQTLEGELKRGSAPNRPAKRLCPGESNR